MAIGPAAGTRIYIGTTTRMATLTTYAADTWTEIGSVETPGDYGDQATDAAITLLADRRRRHFKGSFDAGTMAITCAADPADVGQTALVAAFASDLDYNFKVALNDKLTNGGTPTIQYFYGKVMSKRRTIGNADNVVRQNFSVGINSEILEAAAT